VADDTSAAPAVRTFLIADVRGYTAFTQAHGDEAAARLAARFASACRELVEAGGGRLLELRGDEALCVFDAPRQALRCAVTLQRRFADDTRADPALPLRVGIGIDAGEAVAVEGGYRGGALNLAARLCSMAKAGQVLASEGVVLLARRVDGLEYADQGRVALKGLAEPVRYHALRFELDLTAAEGGPGWTSSRLAMIAVGVVAVLTAAVALAATQLGSGGTHLAGLDANVVGQLDLGGAIRAQTPLAGRPGGIATGAGSIWVTDQARDQVVRIDPATGARTDNIPVGVTPSGVAVGGGGVWVADSGSRSVTWFAPGDPQPHAIGVGVGPDAVAYGAGAAWVANATAGTLQRLDPNRLTASAPVVVGSDPTGVAVGAGSVWVAVSGTNEVVRVDPASLKVVASRAVGAGPSAVAYGAGAVWVANSDDGTVTRIDPDGGPARVVAGVGPDPQGLAFADGRLWVADGLGGRVVRVDPRTLTVVGSTPIAAQAGGLAVAGGRLWVAALPTSASHRGGVLRVQAQEPLDSLDPGYAFAVLGWQLLRITNDGLVAYRATGGPAGGQIVPDLATALPVISADGLTYTFQLRRGIRYSDGTAVRASDFRVAAERGFRVPAAAGQYVTFPDLVGAAACTRAPAACSLAAGIRTDDATGTVTYRLTRRNPSFLEQLALPFGDPVPPGASRHPGRSTLVPATGPYMFKTSHLSGRGGTVLLVRNPRFRVWAAAAQPAGYPDRIRVTFGIPPGRQLAAVMKDEADVMADQPPAGQTAALDTRFASLVHPYAPGSVHYLFLNTRRAPFDNVDARRALDFAVDRTRIVRLWAGGPAAAAVTCQILPPNLQGYAPYCPYTTDPGPGGAWTGPDMGTARRLVRRSGTAGDAVTLVSSAVTRDRASEGYLTQLLRSLGYRARVRRLGGSTQTYFDYISDSRHGAQIGGYGWFQDYADPYDFLGQLFTCASFKPGSPFNANEAEFCDPAYDRLVAHAVAVSATDPGAAATAWQAADRYLVDRAVVIPIYNDVGRDVLSARTGNYEHNPQFGLMLDQLWVK
jgi:YVTN family beta-propeller protein